MSIARPIELLAPAKDLNCGIEAIRHGADAVYIGAPKFGARAAAGNSLEDIRQLCDYAHLFQVRVYVAFNTILYDEELSEAEQLIHQLYDAGVDALIIQDVGITQLNLPPIPLHASTQGDNCTPEKILFWEQLGIKQVVLARELTLDEIRSIAQQTNITLEAFVHGSLCVSYSGRCYLSAAQNGRSANRGECAQLCRLPYTLTDANDQVLVVNKHLLSLKDLNASNELEALLQAGVSSLKIEGRLKDVTYVKNITGFYRKKLDALFAKNPLYYRSSVGTTTYTFQPQPDKSFNRGFTTYFLHGRAPDIVSLDSPKSMGEPVGVVKEIKGYSFTLAGLKPIHNGDGLAFINAQGELEGFRVNRVENNRIFPLKMPALRPKMPIYRNLDKVFEENLDKSTADRRIKVNFELSETPFGFTLTVTDETDKTATIVKPFQKEVSRSNQSENIRTQLSKLGNTSFLADQITISFNNDWFIPSSLLNDMRRDAISALIKVRRIRYARQWVKKDVYKNTVFKYPKQTLDYTSNISNIQAEKFYGARGVESMQQAFELQPIADVPLMYTKHCIRYHQGICPTYQKKETKWKEPFYLTYKSTRLRLKFDCKNCQMLIFADAKSNEGY